MKRSLVLGLSLLLGGMSMHGQQAAWNDSGNGNPFLPGYFADPTIRKFGDTYYIYATTDGTGNGYGPAQCWASKDFVHWKNVLLNWPTTEVVWAPDVIQEPDGSYRYYYCTPCQVYVGESANPTGPWVNRLGASDAVLVPDRFVHNAITLDPAIFRDDDGSEYLYFGTWGIYKGFGCGVAKLSADGKSFVDKKLIENTEITDFFEAPWVFKRNGVYYFMYSSGSCHDDTYRVQYATSTESPMGPYTYKGCVLKTNADGTIHGPGHHSVMQDGDDYYVVYHRHNNPHAIHGFHRQVCIDKMEFAANGDIKQIVPTHEGVELTKGGLGKGVTDLAFGKPVTASSTYSEWFKPEYAVDANNGTLWRAADVHENAWIQVDLGKEMAFTEVWTEFEYPTFFYQYVLETSKDGKTWSVFADKKSNVHAGSPMVDRGKTKARYVRLTITGTQKNGHFPAVWNIHVYNSKENLAERYLPQVETAWSDVEAAYTWIHSRDLADYKAGQLLNLDAEDYAQASVVGGVPVVVKDGVKAFRFNGKTTIEIDTCDLHSLVYNAPYTVDAWVLNENLGGISTVAQLTESGNDLATVELRHGSNPSEGLVGHNASFENAGGGDAVKGGVWQHVTVVFDGFNEEVYVDGVEVSKKNVFLMLRPSDKISIGSGFRGNPFVGYVHSVRVWNYANREVVGGNVPVTSEEVVGDLLHGMTPQLTVERQTGTMAKVRALGHDGQALQDGLFDYAFSVKEKGGKETVVSSSQSEVLLTLPEKACEVGVVVKDIYGNETEKQTQKVARAKGLKNLAAGWGEVKLESEGSNLNAVPDEKVALKTLDLQGDFVLECHVKDLMGSAEQRTPAYNEGGVILISPTNDGAMTNKTQNLVHLGVFPNYNCGNMLTMVSAFGRPQFQNGKGWNFDPYLQLERRGNVIYARTSNDGVLWEEMPQSPLTCDFLSAGSTVQVGLYQTTYTEAKAWMTFDGVKIWRP